MIGASSLVEGDGLSLRGAEYGFGPLHAAVLALVLWLSSGLESAYPWFKVVNALFWALTAIPVYLLARRLVSSWWAVLAAGLAVAIPSSISVATVMTESMAFFVAAWVLVRDDARARATLGAPPVRTPGRDRGRVPDSVATRRALRRLARRARPPLVDQPGGATARASRREAALAERTPARRRPDGADRPGRQRRFAARLARRVLGVVARVRAHSASRSGSSTTWPTSRSTSP